jgi:protocatechuate 3,4-dioxygenase beta subunit
VFVSSLALGIALLALPARAIQDRAIPVFGGQDSAAANRPVTGTAFVLGQVVDAAGGPVASAVVTLSGGLVQSGSFATQVSAAVIPGGPRRTLTNSDGRFLFGDLPKGSYSIDVTKPGYVSGAVGRYRPDGLAQSFELAEGERNGSLKITVWKYAAISGTLTDETGEPLVGATIWSLKRSYAIGRSQFTDSFTSSTDDRGYFRVSGLTPGEYVICVVASQSTLPSALVDRYGQASAAGTAQDLQRQISFSSIGFSSSLGAPGIRMGDWVLYTTGPYSRGMAPPGPDESGRLLSFQTTFYPGVVSLPAAQVITLASGEERMGADIRLTLVPAVPVAGTVVGPGGPVANIGVRLAPEFAGDLGNEQSFEPATTITDSAGRFSFLGVPTGSYTLRAMRVPPVPVPAAPSPSSSSAPPPIPQEPTLWANMPVTVGPEGLTGVTVRLATGFRISGRVVLDGGTAPKPPGSLMEQGSLVMQPVDGHQIGYLPALRGRIDADGTITSYEIPPGKYIIRMVLPAGSWATIAPWLFKGSTVNGVDVAATPLDLQRDVTDLVITLTDHPSEIAGMVRNERGLPDPSAMVLVYPTDPADWSSFGETPRKIRNLRPGLDGRYRVPGLPAGPYFVAAIPDAQAVEWQDPRVLEAVSRTAARITLGDGEKKTQDVVTRPVK